MTPPHALRILTASFLFAGLVSLPAHAANKDIIQLQTEVQQLQISLNALQKSDDENMGMLKELLQQTADAVNTMTTTVNGLKLSMQNQQSAASTNNQQLSGQVQALNDSVDALTARLDKMAKTLATIQSQQQIANAALSNLPQATPATTASGVPPTGAASTTGAAAGVVPAGSNPNLDTSSAPTDSNPNGALGANAQPIPAGAEPVATPVPAAPSAGDMYRGAYADYISARFSLARSEFGALIKAHPEDNLSGNAYFYLGEMDMRSHRPSAAIKDYDQVITSYPDNAKIPAAELHKAYALIDERETVAAERELRELIQRFPVSPEASLARAKLSSLRRQ
ncbi:MAG: tetratricopeptide repeat protein [Acidobacteriaceae bacterium]